MYAVRAMCIADVQWVLWLRWLHKYGMLAYAGRAGGGRVRLHIVTLRLLLLAVGTWERILASWVVGLAGVQVGVRRERFLLSADVAR